MTNLNVSLPEAMKKFIEAEVRKGSYSTPSEFVRELVREFQRRKASQAEQLILDALVSGEPITNDPTLETLHQRIRARINQSLLAAIESGPAVDGEEILTRLQKKNRARKRPSR